MADDEIDVAAGIKRIEKLGFTKPEDGQVILKFLRVLNDERARAAQRIDALEANQVTPAQAATMLAMIEKLAQRVARLETEFAILQRNSVTAN